jgi:dUTP pyrophosphatase
VKIRLFNHHCRPQRAYPTDSGMDLRARIDDSIWLQPLSVEVVPLGIAVELPAGYEAQIRPRSGLSAKGIIAVFGTIDNSYRGEIKVTLVNVSMQRHEIKPYDRIAQLVLAPVIIPEIRCVSESLPMTARGERGFGSTGTE